MAAKPIRPHAKISRVLLSFSCSVSCSLNARLLMLASQERRSLAIVVVSGPLFSSGRREASTADAGWIVPARHPFATSFVGRGHTLKCSFSPEPAHVHG